MGAQSYSEMGESMAKPKDENHSNTIYAYNWLIRLLQWSVHIDLVGIIQYNFWPRADCCHMHAVVLYVCFHHLACM